MEVEGRAPFHLFVCLFGSQAVCIVCEGRAAIIICQRLKVGKCHGGS